MEKEGWQIAFLSTSHLPAVTISILIVIIYLLTRSFD